MFCVVIKRLLDSRRRCSSFCTAAGPPLESEGFLIRNRAWTLPSAIKAAKTFFAFLMRKPPLAGARCCCSFRSKGVSR